MKHNFSHKKTNKKTKKTKKKSPKLKLISLSATVLLMFFLLASFTFAQDSTSNSQLEDLQKYESLTTQITITSSFQIKQEKSNSEISSLTTTLALLPYSNDYQELISLDSLASKYENNELHFDLKNPTFDDHQFEVLAVVKTDSSKHSLDKKIPFPISLTETEIQANNLNDFLATTITIDWDNEDIKAKAAELSQGKDDLFEVALALASWVEDNVEYDLSTINTKTSKTASSVLESKNGVCDEMTSLFIAMSRSLGIPAKFISGLSYTTSDLFDDPWQAHGWAEVYFPEHGWVSFDPTFSQFGYVDSGHIPLKESQDPTDYATLFEWIGKDVDFEDKGITFDVEVLERGELAADKYDLEYDILSQSINFGSYNLITSILKPTTSSYTSASTTLYLPEEIEILESLTPKTQDTLIHPQENKAVYWAIKVPDTLAQDYIYTFPFTIRTETGRLNDGSFTTASSYAIYSLEEIENLIPESKTVNALEKISTDCNYQTEISLNTNSQLTCTIENIDDKAINSLSICFEQNTGANNENCETIDLNQGQTHTYTSNLYYKTAGWHTSFLNLKHEDFDYNLAITNSILDSPDIQTSIEFPTNINFGETFTATITIEPTSFSSPKDISLDLNLGSMVYTWEIEELLKTETILLELDSNYFAKTNNAKITAIWYDINGQIY